MMADLNKPLLEQVIGYLACEMIDGSLPEWRRSRATVLVERLEKVRDALAVTDLDNKYNTP